MSEEFDEHLAKEEILRLNDTIDEAVLLIGGLAVQQYVLERSSKDIDIVCDLSFHKALLANAYGHPKYQKRQRQTDLRPVTEIKNLETGGRVFLGAKILERDRYPFIDYEVLADDSQPFVYDDRKAENVRIPPAHSLAFSKLISFIARRDGETGIKGLNDLSDFSKLTNCESFSLNSIIALVERLGARVFIEEFFANATLTDEEVAILAEASPIRFQSIFPIETVMFVAERGRRNIPTFAPIDSNFRMRKIDITMEYQSAEEMRYTKSKTLVATKNKVGTFDDRFHWTGDQKCQFTSNNPRHILTERARKNVWRRYEIDFQRILSEGDEEEVSLTWALTNKKGDFVPFISTTIDAQTDALSLQLDAQSIPDRIANVQVDVLPMQGSGEPIEVVDVKPKGGVFNFSCENPRLLHTYEMRWTVLE